MWLTLDSCPTLTSQNSKPKPKRRNTIAEDVAVFARRQEQRNEAEANAVDPLLSPVGERKGRNSLQLRRQKWWSKLKEPSTLGLITCCFDPLH
jgi:hypothetical protein